MSNDTSTNEIPSSDTHSAIIYIIGVLIWYAIGGFGLLLIGKINPRIRRIKTYEYKNIYEAVNNLHEHKRQNDILNELKDKDRRKKLWEIYYGTKPNPPITIQKDQETINSITKQLNEHRRILQNTFDDIQTNTDETESSHDSIQ
jgi:hypothetical protein